MGIQPSERSISKPRLRKRRLSKTKSVEVAEAAAAAASDDVEPREKLEEAFKLLDEVEEAWLPKETVCYVCFFFPPGRSTRFLFGERVLCLKRCESERSLKNLCWVV